MQAMATLRIDIYTFTPKMQLSHIHAVVAIILALVSVDASPSSSRHLSPVRPGTPRSPRQFSIPDSTIPGGRRFVSAEERLAYEAMLDARSGGSFTTYQSPQHVVRHAIDFESIDSRKSPRTGTPRDPSPHRRYPSHLTPRENIQIDKLRRSSDSYP
jgi:hypothetical protein